VIPLITTQLSSRQKFTKTRLNAQKERKMGVFRSQSEAAIMSETRPFFALFVRLNAFLKIFVCLGGRDSPVGVPSSM
jgi:hypothetical protein